MYFLWVDNAKCGHAPEIWRESHDAPIYGWVSHTPTLKNEKKVEALETPQTSSQRPSWSSRLTTVTDQLTKQDEQHSINNRHYLLN